MYQKDQIVICVNATFPTVEVAEDFSVPANAQYGKQAESHPQLWEALKIEEVRGEFLRFAKHDSPDAFNWWHVTRFKTPEACLAMLSEFISQNVAAAEAGA